MNLITLIPAQSQLALTFAVSDTVLDLLEDLQIVETCSPALLIEIRRLTQREISREAKRHTV